MGFNPILDQQDEINLVEYVIQHLQNKITELEKNLSFMLELKINIEEKKVQPEAVNNGEVKPEEIKPEEIKPEETKPAETEIVSTF
ncbi:MAG: hypothetical protein R6W90_04250 [Ignavibacteriaceae bacterium]